MKNLLILGRGDNEYNDRSPKRLFEHASQAGMETQRAEYDAIDGIRDFRCDDVNVMLFFPYAFWNANCEVPEDTLLYGTSSLSHKRLTQFFLDKKGALEKRLSGRRVHYLTPPENATTDRDKVETIRVLTSKGLPTPSSISYSSAHDIVDSVSPECGVVIKCRYGAEGKGITLLRAGKWVTNYKVEDNRLGNFGVYDKWHFSDITGRIGLLQQLVDNEVIVEEEILTPDILGGMKFDSRGYAVGEAVPHMFARVNDPERVVTNYSQGATVKHHPDTGLPDSCIEFIRKNSPLAAKAMGVKFLGVDFMFDRVQGGKIIEVQTFADFPDIRSFNMAKYLISNECGLFV